MIPKTLSRLSRSSLVDLATKWLSNPRLFRVPYLTCNRDALEAEEEDYLYEPADDVASLRQIYDELRQDENVSKREIVERIVEGDWRRGLSLHQLAMVDLMYLQECDTSLRWSALKFVPVELGDEEQEARLSKRRKIDCDEGQQEHYPRVQPATFLKALKAEVSPLVKAHYYLHRLPEPWDLTVLRIYITGTPFSNDGKKNTGEHCADGARALYLAMPDSSPYIYVALSSASGSVKRKDDNNKAKTPAVDIAAMKKIILEAVPKALSRPQRRYAMESTNLSTRSLKTISAMRGNGRLERSTGVFGTFATADADATPLEARTDQERQMGEGQERNEKQFDRDARVRLRFGPEIRDVAFDRFNVRIQDMSTSPRTRKRRRAADKNADGEMEEVPISLNFSGADVFTGLRKLAELDDGFIDLDRLPAWMTGENGVSNLVV